MLFLHNTSRVDDEPYPTLLQDKGFGGFPSLAFMDAEGEVLAEPQGRDVADFETALAALIKWRALAEKADRTSAEEAELLLAELDLGKLAFDAARERYAALDGLTDAQKAKIENELLFLEVADIQKKVGRDRSKIPEANAAIAAMAKAGRIPTDAGMRAMRFWGPVMAHADETKDVELFEQGVNVAHAVLGDDPRGARYLESIDKRLAELKSGQEK